MYVIRAASVLPTLSCIPMNVRSPPLCKNVLIEDSKLPPSVAVITFTFT